MQLTDLIPENPTFYLKKRDKEYHLRIPNMEDRANMTRMFGTEAEVYEAFNKRQWDKICKIVYLLLEEKRDFLAHKESQIDIEGIEREVLITGPIVLLRAIGPQEEAVKMLGALTSAFTQSEPLVKDYVDSELKKSLAELSTGEKSSTSSQASTDTALNNLESLPTGS
jgi:hypothetical protein